MFHRAVAVKNLHYPSLVNLQRPSNRAVVSALTGTVITKDWAKLNAANVPKDTGCFKKDQFIKYSSQKN